MSQINDFLSHIDFEEMREYCMADGKTERYESGDCFFVSQLMMIF